MRCQLLWFLLDWILWLALAMFGGQASVDFSGFSFEILAIGPSEDVYHGQCVTLEGSGPGVDWGPAHHTKFCSHRR